MVSDHVVQLCRAQHTVSSMLAQEPTKAPGDIIKELYGHIKRETTHGSEPSHQDVSTDDNERARQCGNWGPAQPSPLFLRAYSDALRCLDTDPLSGVVSPPLMGSHGRMPLTVIAPLVDIIRHCSNLIVKAEKEVIFVTCTWAPSVAQRLIHRALLDLSARAESRQSKVVVKIMFDQAGVANAFDSHQLVKSSQHDSDTIKLPRPDEIPWVELEIINLHKIPLGTLHCKFCIVDKKEAVVMSNNMEDNANMEMMTHLEGPIVEGIYDTALITWHKRFEPPLPMCTIPKPQVNGEPAQGPISERRRSQQAIARDGEVAAHQNGGLPEHTPEDPHYDATIAEEMTRMQACYSTKEKETRLEAANRQLNLAVQAPILPTGPEIPDGQEMTPYIATDTSLPVPMALVSRAAYPALDTSHVYVPQNEAWLSLIRNAKKDVFIQTPDLNAKALLPTLRDAASRGVQVTYYVCFGYNDAGEMIPGQGGTNEQAATSLIHQLLHPESPSAPVTAPARENLRVYYYVAKDQDRPIHQSEGTRACHVKLLIADGAVGVQGSGNQDTQSWYHSQELNVMVDSEEICAQWREGIERNQNTGRFGMVEGDDGVWRDSEGQPGRGYSGQSGAVTSLVHGVWGMYKKSRGKH